MLSTCWLYYSIVIECGILDSHPWLLPRLVQTCAHVGGRICITAHSLQPAAWANICMKEKDCPGVSASTEARLLSMFYPGLELGGKGGALLAAESPLSLCFMWDPWVIGASYVSTTSASLGKLNQVRAVKQDHKSARLQWQSSWKPLKAPCAFLVVNEQPGRAHVAGMVEAKLEPEDGYVKISHPGTSKPPRETQPTSKTSCAFSTQCSAGWITR